MGGGIYSSSSKFMRNITEAYHAKTLDQIFTNQKLDLEMAPHKALFRESRDSEEHPNSVPIIIALDLTGSMGSVPKEMIQDGLPTMVQTLLDNGIDDPQILFLGIGDHECDQAPLQVGQFESSDELIDKWLLATYLEGGGGGNAGESYLLAWYYAGYHTAHDRMDKRNQKGLLFTIGDEPNLKNLPSSVVKNLMGKGNSDFTSEYQGGTADDLLKKASELYDVYHINVRSTHSGRREEVATHWKQNLSDNFVSVQSHTEVAKTIAEIVNKHVSSSMEALIPTTDTADALPSGGDTML